MEGILSKLETEENEQGEKPPSLPAAAMQDRKIKHILSQYIHQVLKF